MSIWWLVGGWSACGLLAGLGATIEDHRRGNSITVGYLTVVLLGGLILGPFMAPIALWDLIIWRAK